MELQQGTTGGVNTLNADETKRVDPDVSEKFEPANEQPTDLVDAGLSQVLGEFVGGHLSDRVFDLPLEPGNSRVDQLVFDRFYFDRNLLVDLFQTTYSEEEKARLDAEVERKRSFAIEHGFKYLAIVGNEMPVAEVQKAIL